MAAKDFSEYLASLPKVPPALMVELERLSGSDSIRPRQLLHSSDHTLLQLLYVEEGLLHRYYYNDQGATVSTGFYLPGDAFLLFGKMNVADKDYLESLQQTQLRTVAQADIAHLYPLFPDLQLLAIHLLRSEFARAERRTRLLHMPALSRYARFRQVAPEVFRTVPLRLIASYLNMTRENLSRLIGRDR